MPALLEKAGAHHCRSPSALAPLFWDEPGALVKANHWEDGMSTTSRGQAFSAESAPTGASGGYTAYSDDDRGYGWVAFAGVLLLMLGTLNCIEGIAAISNAHFFHHNVNYVFGSLNAWGWTML